MKRNGLVFLMVVLLGGSQLPMGGGIHLILNMEKQYYQIFQLRALSGVLVIFLQAHYWMMDVM